MITISAYIIARRFLGLAEIAGVVHNPQIVAFHQLDNPWISDDETPWCSSFVNYVAWLCSLQRSKSPAARSWLNVGHPIDISDACKDADVVILKRGSGMQPGPEVTDAPGHVGFYSEFNLQGGILLLGGNQGNAVSIKAFNTSNILRVMRLEEEL